MPIDSSTYASTIGKIVSQKSIRVKFKILIVILVSSRNDMVDVKYEPSEIQFVTGQRGSKLLSLGGFNFVKNRSTDNKTYWICSRKVKWFFKTHQDDKLLLTILCFIYFSTALSATLELSQSLLKMHQAVLSHWVSCQSVVLILTVLIQKQLSKLSHPSNPNRFFAQIKFHNKSSITNDD